MILRLRSLTLLAAVLCLPIQISCLDIPSDTPVSSLISSAKVHLARGDFGDALQYFDAAISRDPSNYLPIFQRGATYLSLGRNNQASADFDKVLKIKPDFEAALLQRAKIKAKNADWITAKEDYTKAGKKDGSEIAEIDEAQGAAILARSAERNGNWEECISQAGVAIMTASTALSLRQLRARCRFERGEVQEGVSDLAHVLQISPGLVEPHLQISTMLFYSLGDTDKAVSQLKKCLHSDPDSKACSRLHRREKQVAKSLKQVRSLMSERQFNSVTTLLVGSSDSAGLLQEIKDDIAEAKSAGTFHANSPNSFYTSLVEMTCEAYREMKSIRKAASYCAEALTLNPHSLHGLLAQAQRQIDADDFEPAISTLNRAKEHHPSDQRVETLLSHAHALLKRSKQKDYYKVLSVSREADDRTIKKAYRNLVKLHHPDKSMQKGLTKEEAEKKMASINEAYEVLSDPELKARFDRGEDPNSQEAQQNPFQGSPFGTGPQGQPFFFKHSGGQQFGGQQFKMNFNFG